MKRVMTIGGRRVKLEQLDEIMALSPGASGADVAGPQALGGEIGAAASCLDRERFLKDVERLTAAGWRFVRRPRGAPERGLRAAPVHVVYCDPGGHVKIGGRGLAVRLSPEMSEAEAERWLVDHGLTPLRKLGFQRNLFLAPAPEGADTLRLAAELAGEDAVVYAEPQLVEVIGPREDDDGTWGAI